MAVEANQAPRRFGRYILLDRLGMGGMAEVYRAIMPGADGFRRDLVIKRIIGEQARSPNFIEMFGHEARISALLHHPNIVQVFDFGSVDGSYFLAMELLRGRDLSATIRSLRERQRPFPIPIAAYIAQQVARGLAYAHTLTAADGQPLNIVHRDVSPSNVMCLRAGGVKLLDFGIASALGEIETSETETGSFKGKLTYSAPERLRNQVSDGRADLFSLGAVLWEMLCGKRLFAGKTQVDKLHAVLERQVPAPSSIRADVPPELDRIVMRALERDIDKRYPIGTELADDLERLVLDLKVQSSALPNLLDELFGSAPSAAHVAISSLSPDLLVMDPAPMSLLATPTAPTAIAVPERFGAGGPALPVLTGSFSGAITPPPPMALPHPIPVQPAGTATMVSASPARRLVRRLRALPVRTKAMVGAALVVTLAGVGIAVAMTPGKATRTRVAGPTTSAQAPAGAGALESKPGMSPPAPGDATPPGATAARAEAEHAEPSSPSPSSPSGATRPVAIAAPESPPEPATRSAAPSANTTASNHAARPARPRPIPPRPRPTERAASGRVARGLSIDPFAEAAARTGKKP